MNAKECEINVGDVGRNTRIFKDKDGVYKHKDDSSVNAPPPAPEGGYTNEALYNKLYSVETYMVSSFRELRLEMASLKSQYQTQNQDIMKMRIGMRMIWMKTTREFCVICCYAMLS